MARRNRQIGRGLLAGLAGGLVAAWTMNQFQTAWTKTAESMHDKPSQQQQQSRQEKDESQAEVEDATMKAADQLSRTVLHRALSKEEKKKAGPVVHYVFGGAMGAHGNRSYSARRAGCDVVPETICALEDAQDTLKARRPFRSVIGQGNERK